DRRSVLPRRHGGRASAVVRRIRRRRREWIFLSANHFRRWHGARLGGFEGMTAGIGPEISYAYSVGGLDLAAEVKWLPEIGVANRLSGNTVWFKLAVSFGANKENPLDAL